MKGLFRTELNEIEQLIVTSKYQEANSRLDKLLINTNLLEEEKIQAKILKARVYLDIQPFYDALINSKLAYEKSLEIGNPLLIFDSANVYYRSLSYLGFTEKAVDLGLQMKKTLESYEDKESIEFLKRKSQIAGHIFTENFQDNINLLDEAIQVSDDIGDYLQKGWLIFQKAYFYANEGDYSQSEKIYDYGIKVFTEIGHKMGILACTINKAAKHVQTGALDKYLSLTMKGLSYAEEINSSYSLGGIYADLGLYYWQKGELNTALQYYKKSMKQIIKGKLFGHHHYPAVLFRMNQVYLEQNNLDEVERNLEKMEIVATFRDLQNIGKKINLLMIIYRLAQAVYLKKISLDENYDLIENYLQEIIDAKWGFLEYRRLALFHLCDLYMTKIKQTNDPELLKSIEQILTELDQLAHTQKSHILHSQILLLKANFALIELQIDEAKKLLERAQAIADEMGITRLATMISNEYDHLLEQMNSWENFTLKLPNIADRMELTHLEDMMENLMKNRTSYAEISDEEESPSLFLIMDKDGHVLFSDNFEPVPVQMDLTQGIISTIHDYLEEDHAIERIYRLKFNNYTLVLHQNNDLIVCYVFEGKSYSALQKFKQLINDYTTFNDIWGKLHQKIIAKEELSLEDRSQFTDYLESIFV